MSNRSYLVGLYVGLAALAIGCLFLFGNLFAHANNTQPKISHQEMKSIIADYKFSNQNQGNSSAFQFVPRQYFNNSGSHHDKNDHHPDDLKKSQKNNSSQ